MGIAVPKTTWAAVKRDLLTTLQSIGASLSTHIHSKDSPDLEERVKNTRCRRIPETLGISKSCAKSKHIKEEKIAPLCSLKEETQSYQLIGKAA